MLDLDVYMYCILCVQIVQVCNSSYADYTVFYIFLKAQSNLRWLRMGRRRLDYVIYVGRVSRHRLLGLTYDGPPEPS
jgi:hypothetical protein